MAVHTSLPRVAASLACACVLTSAVQAQTVLKPSAPPNAQPDAVYQTQGDGRQGTFKTIQGDVTVVSGNMRSAAVVGGGLQAADRIVTGADSAAAVILKDGTMLSIGPNSSVDLAEFHFNTTTHEGNMLLSLARGSMRVVTGLLAKLNPEQVKVTTPTTVIGVRGTDFIVEENI